MKRHEALAPLSRDHHNTLILAQLLKKNAPVYRGLPVISKEKAGYANEQYEQHIKKHFQQEETILDKVKHCHPEISQLAVVIVTEHKRLNELFLSLDSTDDLDGNLDRLGRALKEHIRLEERILFPLLQQHCAEDMLEEISILLH